jgi:hypothetical protein
MLFHFPSYALGLATGLVASGVRDRLRPVLLEAAAVTTTFSKIGWAVVERQREWIEDLWADVQERVAERLRSDKTSNGHSAEGAARAPS